MPHRAGARLVMLIALLLVPPIVAFPSAVASTATAAVTVAAATSPSTVGAAAAAAGRCATAPKVPRRWCAAVSQPHRDSRYPRFGTDVVDSLHHRLALRWAPGRGVLYGRQRLVFRVARDAAAVPLSLDRRVRVTSVRLDGRSHAVRRDGDLLVLPGRVRAGEVHRLRLRYTVRPRPAPAPAWQRDALGVHRTDAGDLFTNDEPVGAFTWYAVNDQPADKALYDFRLSVPAPRVGVANGRLLSQRRVGGRTLTRFRLDRPASSYLTVVTFARYTMTRLRPLHGVALTTWTPVGDRRAQRRAGFLRPALRWVERRLGRYPYATLAVVVVPGYGGGMENQTLITLGDNRYDTSRETLIHEVAHQWYGDLVTPTDWRDLWMNEGMATYLEKVWHAGRIGRPLEEVMASLRPDEALARRMFGPPGAYRRGSFAELNVYYGPALMWYELRRVIGSAAFWAMVRDWPATHAGNADRATYLAWVQRRLGRDLSGFFRAWLLGRDTPRPA